MEISFLSTGIQLLSLYLSSWQVGQVPCDIPSATQWTSVTDMRNHVIYYRTMYNSVIRNIDLRSIDFSTVRYRAVSMDGTKRQAVETIKIE